MNRITRVPMAAAFVLSLWSGAFAAPTVITSCGQTVAEGALAGDLDCSAAHGFAVTVSDGGSLDLAGHQLTGTADHSLAHQTPIFGGGVQCLGECIVSGNGGAIIAPAGLPWQTWYSIGIYSDSHLKNSKVVVSDTDISGWAGYGVVARRIEIADSTLSDNYYGLSAIFDLSMVNCTVSGNQEGAHIFRGSITNSDFSGNNFGIYLLRRLKFVDSSVTSSASYGFEGGKLLAEGSTLTGNCVAPPGPLCADILARPKNRPRLRNSTCGTSMQWYQGPDWNVCELDD